MSNRLIVESNNDKFFMQSLVEYLNKDINITRINLADNDYLPLAGSDSTKIKNELRKIKDEARKNPINKVGIVLDMDYRKLLDWLEIINDVIREVFSENQETKIKATSSFINIISEDIPNIQIACYFINVNGIGELEDLLKTIKSHPSPHADCLESWQSCVEKYRNESISSTVPNKELNKIWVEVLIKYDISSPREQNNAGKYCNFEYVMKNKQHIWDFEHPALDELKEFLKLFD